MMRLICKNYLYMPEMWHHCWVVLCVTDCESPSCCVVLDGTNTRKSRICEILGKFEESPSCCVNLMVTREKAGYVKSLANTRKSRTLRVLGIVCECWIDVRVLGIVCECGMNVNVGWIVLRFVSWWIKMHDLSFSLKSQMSCIHYLLTCSYPLRLLNLTLSLF